MFQMNISTTQLLLLQIMDLLGRHILLAHLDLRVKLLKEFFKIFYIWLF